MVQEDKKKQDAFSEDKDLNKEEKKHFEYANKRIGEMKEYRKRDHYGVKLDTLWAQADRDYIPHRLKTKSGKKVVVTDEDKGWRGTLVNLGDSNWQSDIAQSNPFIKISTALSVLVDQNPTGVFTATAKKYTETTELIKQLYSRSWEYAKSKQQLKLFIHNLAKYGWACGRTYPLRIERKVQCPVGIDTENPDKTKYEEKTVVVYNDIMRDNLDPRNTWIDDTAKPNTQFSLRDWCFRKVYTMDSFKEEFGKYALAEKVTAGGIVTEVLDQVVKNNSEKTETDLVEVYFYENILKDLFMVIANGVPVVITPLPISDEKGNKKLSLWQAYWNLRHALSPYGIGIYEAVRYDQSFLDRIRNMTIDQITLSIYKMFFYQGTQNLADTGDITIRPGVGKQVIDPKNISWLEVPGPGKDAFALLEMFRKDVDDASGITAPLIGEITGKTAFEIAQAKEAAVKRLKTPLDNITDALNDEGYITVTLIQALYSLPEIVDITDPQLIAQYLQETGSDQELFQREETTNELGEPEEKFQAKIYREFPLNLEKDEKGNLIETAETQFFRAKPSALKWEGIISIKSQSVLTPSKQIDKALDLEMYQVLIPLFTQPPELYKKVAENIAKLYDKDPQDVLPEHWLVENPIPTPMDPLMVSAEGAPGGAPAPGAVPPSGLGPDSITSKVSNRMSEPFRRI